jgi:hypothetical protein
LKKVTLTNQEESALETALEALEKIFITNTDNKYKEAYNTIKSLIKDIDGIIEERGKVLWIIPQSKE